MSAIELTCWDEIRLRVRAINPRLAKIIDALSPGKDMPFVKASYGYGELIIDAGSFCWPSRVDKQSPLFKQVSSLTHRQLSGARIPLCLLLNRSSEVFLQPFQLKRMSLNVIEKGSFFGLFEFMDQLVGVADAPVWSVSAGCLSSCVLPKIANSTKHRRLVREFGVSANLPVYLPEQSVTFINLMQSHDLRDHWSSDIILFTDAWLDKYFDSHWGDFYRYVFRKSWVLVRYKSLEIRLSLLWQEFAAVLGKRSLKPRPYVMEVCKYFMAASLGQVPVFVPADNDDALPAEILGKVYEDVYGVEYDPTFMRLAKKSVSKHQYYSFGFPMIEEGVPFSGKGVQIMTDLRKLKDIFSIFLSEAALYVNDNFFFENSASCYQFCHSNTDSLGEISSVSDVIRTDKRIFYRSGGPSNDDNFCYNSQFFRGCVQLSDQ